VQFQVINKNSLNSMPPNIRQKFLMAAADAAKEANEMDRKFESEFRQMLVDKKMEIHKPSAAELKMWQGTGEALWPEYGKGIDKSVLERMVALR
jgi:TRAP-type C4-dicarboxylate transport system substrate-binding protein